MDNNVCIIGSKLNDFPWEKCKKKYFIASGLVFDKKYIITIRSRIINCKKIIAYFNDDNNIYKTKCNIVFQHYDFNILILEFTSTKIINGINFTNKFIIPEGICSVIKNNIFFKNQLKYKISNYSIIFKKSKIINNEYLYSFKLKEKHCLRGILGGIIYKDNDIIGIITKNINKKLYALPYKCLYTCIQIFYNKTSNEFMRFIIGEKNNKINPEEIININNKELKEIIYDEDLKDYIPLDIYININKTIIKTNKKEIELKKIKNKYISFTNMTFFEKEIPYKRYENSIIVELTYELIDLFYLNNIENEIINNYLKKEEEPKPILLLINENIKLIKKINNKKINTMKKLENIEIKNILIYP